MEIRPHPPPGAPTVRLGILMTALIVLVAGFGASRTSAFQWFLLRASLQNQFPQVQWITTRELADWLEDQHRPPPVLLDVRTVKEWSVSHLPGARRVDPGASAEMALPGAARDVPVVTYLRSRLSLRRTGYSLARGRFHARAKSRWLDFPVGE
jgi:hypothetical protein